MIKALATTIREFIIRGVTTLPPLKNLVPRFTKWGRAQETMTEALIIGKWRCRDCQKEENFSVSQTTFFFCAWATELFDDSIHVALLTRFPFCESFIECFGWEDLYQVPRWCEPLPIVWDFKIERDLARVEMTFSRIIEQGGYTESCMRSRWSESEVNDTKQGIG
jgi:hypothetical protein